MNVIIIEDEQPSARRLKRMLEKQNIITNVLLHSVEASILWFKTNNHPDLIFLDIQLSDGLSFEIFEAVNIKSSVIFTTAYDTYALQAFKLNSIQYLLKPINEAELTSAIAKYKTMTNISSINTIDFNAIKHVLTRGDCEHKTRFTVKVGQHIKLINVSDIECVYAQNKGVYLYTVHKSRYLIDRTLDDICDDLNPKIFFRVNRKFFININAIKNMVSFSNSRLKIVLNTFDEDEIIVAREKVKAFKSWLG